MFRPSGRSAASPRPAGAFRATALLLALCLAGWSAAFAADEPADLQLGVAQELIDIGLTTHLLPRFRFRTRIRVAPVAGTEGVDMTLAPEAEGTPVFSGETGEYRLAIVTPDAERAARAGRFLEWLRSGPGRTAIESFEVDGERRFVAGARAVERSATVAVEGDAARGAELALLHCGRCHVIDRRNTFGGIGSTPSFGAMRAAPDWLERFDAFWTFNPHPAFTQVEGVTEPFRPERPPPIAPLRLTLDEARAITAFVATLPPKDLGGQVRAR